MTLNVSTYSATPASNSSISGINIAEGCNASNINDAIRQIMADIAAWFATVPTVFVNSVAGRTGAVTLTTADITDLRIGTAKTTVQSGGSPSGGNDGDIFVIV